MAHKEIIHKLVVPEKVSVNVKHPFYTIKGAKGEVVLRLDNPNATIELNGKEISLRSIKGTKKEKKVLNTYTTKIKNAFKGVNETYVYQLKVCSGHFPMNVTFTNGLFTIKNFLGEKVPRKMKVESKNVSIKIDGQLITVESPDKELAGQAAASIEQLCRRPGFDRRIFQDGIYIINKAGKEI